MASKKLGETKGPFVVWLFATFYFIALSAFGGSSSGSLPEEVTPNVILSLLVAMARSYGVILVFLVVFLALWEKRRSLKDIFSSIGFRREGILKSVFWSVILFPLFIAIGLIWMTLSYFFVPGTTSDSSTGQIPIWYLWYIVIHSFFPVAVVEEAFARGYMLDRLMPQHPSSLARALPAILLSSLLFTLWHLPAYLRSLAPWVGVLLASNVFPMSVALNIAYVRARTRNVTGLVFIHFLLDSMPMLLMLTR